MLPIPAVDLYSDTVTRPTPTMRRAMAEAEVGDEQQREDPTVNRLQETVAPCSARRRRSTCRAARCATRSRSRSTAVGDEIILH